MTVIPSQLIVSTLLGLAALFALLLGLALLRAAWRRPRYVRRTERGERVVVTYGDRRLLLFLALALVLLVFGGQYLVGMLRPSSGDTPPVERGINMSITGASGAQLAIQALGPTDAPVIVFTHGWGADGREWSYYRTLADRYRLLIWDLPGLGASTAMPGDYTMEKMAGDLRSVVATAGQRPVLLVGHSIGGMLNLTYAELYPDDLGSRVKGIAQFNTTFTNPLRTTKDAERHVARQDSLYEPLLRGVEVVSPVVRGLGWLSYTSGLAHLQLAAQSFAGAETREQLDFAARYAYRSSPRVVASGVLAMMDWDATAVLPQIPVPVLIVAGAQDTTTLPDASLVMKRDIRDGRLVPIEPAAHLGPIEQHERYAAELRRFADELLHAGPKVARVP